MWYVISMNPELLRLCCPQDDEILGPAGHAAGWIWKLCLSQQHNPLFIYFWNTRYVDVLQGFSCTKPACSQIITSLQQNGADGEICHLLLLQSPLTSSRSAVFLEGCISLLLRSTSERSRFKKKKIYIKKTGSFWRLVWVEQKEHIESKGQKGKTNLWKATLLKKKKRSFSGDN